MYLLSIAFGPTVVGFMFKTKETANKATMNLATFQPSKDPTQRGNYAVIEDDFGMTATIMQASYHGSILEDLDQSKMARAEQMVHQSRCQNLAAKIATSDPALRTMGSPAVITPHGMSPNGFRG